MYLYQQLLSLKCPIISNKIEVGNDHSKQSEAKKNLILRNLDMFVWTSGFHNPLIHTDFNMFMDEWTSANESPGFVYES